MGAFIGGLALGAALATPSYAYSGYPYGYSYGGYPYTYGYSGGGYPYWGYRTAYWGGYPGWGYRRAYWGGGWGVRRAFWGGWGIRRSWWASARSTRFAGDHRRSSVRRLPRAEHAARLISRRHPTRVDQARVLRPGRQAHLASRWHEDGRTQRRFIRHRSGRSGALKQRSGSNAARSAGAPVLRVRPRPFNEGAQPVTYRDLDRLRRAPERTIQFHFTGANPRGPFGD